MILLPAIDIRDGRAVRLAQGDYAQETVYDEDPVSVAKRFASEGAEWLHVVDLDAALLGQPKNRNVVRAVIESVPMLPVEASGGIRSIESIEDVHLAGAARVVLGTQALKEPGFVKDAIDRYGAESIAVGLDVRGTRLQARGWTEDAGELYPTLEALDETGVETYVVTDVAKDGMLAGPNIDLLKDVMGRTKATVVASGGVSSLDDLRALKDAGVQQCIVGKALYSGAFTLPEAIEAAK